MVMLSKWYTLGVKGMLHVQERGDYWVYEQKAVGTWTTLLSEVREPARKAGWAKDPFITIYQTKEV